jgi:hypothetical protein
MTIFYSNYFLIKNLFFTHISSMICVLHSFNYHNFYFHLI